MHSRREDETLSFIKLIKDEMPDVSSVEGCHKVMADMRAFIKEMLKVSHELVVAATGAMEYDMEQVVGRLYREGTKANLKMFRSGNLYKRATQFELLQRIDMAYDQLMQGEVINKELLQDEED